MHMIEERRFLSADTHLIPFHGWKLYNSKIRSGALKICKWQMEQQQKSHDYYVFLCLFKFDVILLESKIDNQTIFKASLESLSFFFRNLM